MRLLANIKMLFKSLKSNFLITFSTFLLLPLVLSLFLGNILNANFESSISVDPIPIKITDNDKSNASMALKDFIVNDNKNLFYINDDDADLNLIIPKNYEKSLNNKKSININIKKLENRGSVDNLLKDIVDDYHENLYLSNLDLDNKSANIFSKPSISTTFIKSAKNQSSNEYYAISMLVFLLLIFMSNNVSANYITQSNGINKRMYSFPIKRTTQLIYDFLISVIYALVFVIIYILINRFLNIAFDENLIYLFIISLVACTFVACVSIFIASFFSKTLGSIIISIIMIIQIILGGIFFPISNGLSSFIKFSPLNLVSELFMKFSINNTLDSVSFTIFIMLILSLVLFLATFIKEKYSWREF
ncbi:ABC-2 family transporter protein [uncultured Clostridium sp.]|nr:ABC-2 family transporter protein [uncultured Clostridium sp.]SCI84770.1 ABC-2 family transporter protein [uncultured Clostridium sp.]